MRKVLKKIGKKASGYYSRAKSSKAVSRAKGYASKGMEKVRSGYKKAAGSKMGQRIKSAAGSRRVRYGAAAGAGGLGIGYAAGRRRRRR